MSKRKPITHDGLSLTAPEWAKRTGIPAATILARLGTLGWDVARTLTTPSDRRFGRGGRRKKDAPRPCPLLKKHPTGQAYCRWYQDEKTHWRYFGAWKSKEAKAAYRRFQMEWAAGPVDAVAAGTVVLVGDIGLRWLAHCERTYLKRGRPTSEVYNNRAAWAVANEYGDTPAAEFDPRRLRAVREAMVQLGWQRKTVNDQVARIVRGFGWAVTEKLVPKDVYDLLTLVEPLVKGRTSAPERKPREPVPDGHVEAVLPHLHKLPHRRAVLAAMVELQRATGMRPGELCTLRLDDLDRRAVPWRYEVTEYNKMLHKDVRRVVFVGPRGRAILAPFLADAVAGEPLFRFPPRTTKKKTPAVMSPITVHRYRAFIRQACEAAGIPVWSPHRLRHNKATEVMDRYESDAAAGSVIGDSPEVARQVYAHRPGEAVAKRIAEATG